jgi:hypothetical protein
MTSNSNGTARVSAEIFHASLLIYFLLNVLAGLGFDWFGMSWLCWIGQLFSAVCVAAVAFYAATIAPAPRGVRPARSRFNPKPDGLLPLSNPSPKPPRKVR